MRSAGITNGQSGAAELERQAQRCKTTGYPKPEAIDDQLRELDKDWKIACDYRCSNKDAGDAQVSEIPARQKLKKHPYETVRDLMWKAIKSGQDTLDNMHRTNQGQLSRLYGGYARGPTRRGLEEVSKLSKLLPDKKTTNT